MVAFNGRLIDAVVVAWCSLEQGNRHRLALQPSGDVADTKALVVPPLQIADKKVSTLTENSADEEGSATGSVGSEAAAAAGTEGSEGKDGSPLMSGEFECDLNEANHCMQRFESAADYETARQAHCAKVQKDGEYIEDAITGKKLLVEGQVQNINLAMGNGAEDKDDDTNELVRGVTTGKWMAMKTISDLADILTEPSPNRQHGTIDVQPVLIRAGPGTGKTWSMQQLGTITRYQTRAGSIAWPCESLQH